MDKVLKTTLDKLRELQEISREAHALQKKLKGLQARESTLQNELDQIMNALSILEASDADLAAEMKPLKVISEVIFRDRRIARESGEYPDQPEELPSKPTSLAEIIAEITASLEGEFKTGDVRKILLERAPELHGKSHSASITTALARLAEGGTLERISGRGRGKEAIFRRKVERSTDGGTADAHS
jgi:hypothetical protein